LGWDGGGFVGGWAWGGFVDLLLLAIPIIPIYGCGKGCEEDERKDNPVHAMRGEKHLNN
jgi:hypothetical protein